jgi:pyruvate dehydrogenase (quinone)
MLQAALQHAVHNKGVAVLGLPGDITNLSAAAVETTTTLFRNKPVVIKSQSKNNLHSQQNGTDGRV